MSNDDQIKWTCRYCGLEIGKNDQEGSLGAIHTSIWKFSYWLFIMPLTLVSAFLLLTKPRHTIQTSITPPNSTEGI